MKKVCMNDRLKIVIGLACGMLWVILSVQAPVFAKGPSASPDRNKHSKYIVVLEDPPLAAYDGRAIQTPERSAATTRLPATANRITGQRKLNVRSPESKKYLRFLDERFESFRGEALLRLGRQLKPTQRFRNALNGFSTSLTASEARALTELSGVKSVYLDKVQHLETDSGPNWLGADKIIAGTTGYPASGGEGMVIGMIDSGINWDHPSFQDPGEGLPPDSGLWDHVNPYGSQLGLCSMSEVLCNDKLVGVYDFVEDDPDTDETEEYNNGKDNEGHGSHVASIAAGNPVNLLLGSEISSFIPARIAGVAPNANIISYRVCYIGSPSVPHDDGCLTSAILKAIDQAIDDQVDVVNYSIGTDLQSPWDVFSTNLAFLNLREAGIFVATSAGNEGSAAGSIGSPANVPWIAAVGNATHDRVFASALENLSGGDTIPPTDMIGASFTDGLESRNIVLAKDYGSALCVNSEPEWGGDCASNTGASSPFAPGTFNNDEIVVCERGDGSRIEKGKNVMLAGAGGFVLINTAEWGESTIADNHCLPATHLGEKDGQKLTTWLDSGSNHKAALSGFSIFHIPEAGDSIAETSSRGPNLWPVEDVLKPDLIAPGTLILGAAGVDDNFAFQNGTSMASPHVSGGAALVKSVHPEWSVEMISSAIIMTSTPELAWDFDGSEATPHKRGAGRPRLDQAVHAGLYLDESISNFLDADPDQGGDPKNLNLPGLVDTVCHETCSFQRTVTDLVGGASWSASVEGLPSGALVSVTPGSFSLASGASQVLTIDVDVSQAGKIGSWIYGDVKLSSSGLPDAVFPLAVFADGGELPAQWQISSDGDSGWQVFTLEGLSAMPDATYRSAGLVVPTKTIAELPQDPNEDDPYDRSAGILTEFHYVPAGTLWLHTEILETTAEDMDLYVGRDSNGDGIAQDTEELCSSISSTELDYCDLYTPEEGTYWIIVQNWAAAQDPDQVTLESAVVSGETLSRLVASGNGIVPQGQTHEVRLSWDNVNAVPGTELIGAVGIGSNRENPNNIGIVPVRFTKTGVAEPETLVLMNGLARGLTVAGNGMHDRAFFDVPPGSDTFTVQASSAVEQQNGNLQIELYRVAFDDAFTNAPFAPVPNTGGSPLKSATGSGDTGPVVNVSGVDLVPGRWFVVLKNNGSTAIAAELQADVTFTGEPIALRGGLWQPASRPGIAQGYDFNKSGASRALIWYTYDEEGIPVWFVAADLEQEGNIWVSELRRFTNDGTLQQSEKIGSVSVTTLAEQDEIFSFLFYGDEGSDRMFPNSDPICPTINDQLQSYTGMWSRPAIGVGGASALVNGTSQGYLHYVYDDLGRPIWLLAADATDNLPTRPDMILTQWSGFCTLCTGAAPTYEDVGMFTRDFVDENNISWNLDYELKPPLSGVVNRSDDTVKLTLRLPCQ